MKFKVELSIELPEPDYYVFTDDGQPIALDKLSDEDIQELGQQYAEKMLSRKKELAKMGKERPEPGVGVTGKTVPEGTKASHNLPDIGQRNFLGQGVRALFSKPKEDTFFSDQPRERKKYTEDGVLVEDHPGNKKERSRRPEDIPKCGLSFCNTNAKHGKVFCSNHWRSLDAMTRVEMEKGMSGAMRRALKELGDG